MAGKQKNMFGGFGAAAQQRKEQQEQIEAAVTGIPAPGTVEGRARKRGEDATTITLAISREDKALIKSWAAVHGTTMSEMLHKWIIQTCKDER